MQGFKSAVSGGYVLNSVWKEFEFQSVYKVSVALSCREVGFIGKHGQNAKLVSFCLRSESITPIQPCWDAI